MVWPCAGPSARVLSTRTSSVPWSMSPWIGGVPRLGMLGKMIFCRDGVNYATPQLPTPSSQSGFWEVVVWEFFGSCGVGELGISPLLLGHERVLVVGGGRERLLERPRAGPAHQVELRARLVVRAGPARAAERLLPDHRTGGLVVDVEVPRRVAQRRHCLAYR